MSAAATATPPAPAAAPIAVACERVTYVYPDGTRASDGIDLALRRGELFCLLGPNGAGKTTLIRQITGDLRPCAGRITICGVDVQADPAAIKRRLGVIPQNVGLYDMLTVEDHLRLFGPLKRLSRADTRTQSEALLREVGLADARRKRVSALSGGERRRILVALALLADPDVLVLDEPTVGLDPIARRLLWATIARQRDAGKAILLTTHYLDEAERLADRIGFIEHGRLTRVGTLAELHAHVGQSVRVVELDDGAGPARAQHYFDGMASAQAFIREHDLRAYSVGRVSLEDIYLRLMGHALDAGSPG